MRPILRIQRKRHLIVLQLIYQQWNFTNALADPRLVRRVEKITDGINDDDDDVVKEPSENEAADPSKKSRARLRDTVSSQPLLRTVGQCPRVAQE